MALDTDSEHAPDGALTPTGDPVSRFVATIVDHVIRAVPVLAPCRRIAETIARFAGVGGASSILYAMVVVFGVSTLRLNHDLAALLGFAVTMPFNFLMHRYFTFRSIGFVHDDVRRYLMMQAVNLVLSLGAMAVSVDGLHLPYAIGIVGAILVIPVMTYFVMDRWVFQQKAG